MQLPDNIHAFMWESMAANNCNTYLIDGPTRILIDPGHTRYFNHVEAGLAEIGLTPADIGLVICTHCHPDHLEAAVRFSQTPALLTFHQAAWGMIKEMDPLMASFGIKPEDYQPDFFLQEGDLSVNGVDLQVIHAPGHSPGSVALYWPARKALFTGDVVFKEGLGRTDLPGGDGKQLKESIRRLAGIDAEWIFPGHGESVAGAGAVIRNFENLEGYWFNYI